jgi:hypothetical protein
MNSPHCQPASAHTLFFCQPVEMIGNILLIQLPWRWRLGGSFEKKN